MICKRELKSDRRTKEYVTWINRAWGQHNDHELLAEVQEDLIYYIAFHAACGP